jgi:hypothetical protein
MRHTRAEVIRRTVGEYRRLNRLIARMGRQDWKRPVPRPEGKDAWTVKDSLVHIVYWKANTLRVMHRAPRPRAERGLDLKAVNRLIYRRWKKRPLREVLAWHGQVQKDLLAALKAMPADWFGGKAHAGTKWPYDLDGHSADHRIHDIQQALRKSAK